MAEGNERERIEAYLNRLMAGKLFTVDDLRNLSVQDLLSDTPIEDIDKTVLETELKRFQKDYSDGIFEM